MIKCLQCNNSLTNRGRNFVKYCNSKCKRKYLYNKDESKIRRDLRKKYNNLLIISKKCFYCQSNFNNNKTIEHIIPNIYLEQLNIVIVCETCNKSKGNKNLLQWAKDKNINLSQNCINKYNKLKNLK